MRVILIGDNQFELYSCADDALFKIERPEASSGKFHVFDESGQKFEFIVNPDDDSHVGSYSLQKCSGGGIDELHRYYTEWIDYNKIKNLPEPSSALFDDLQAEWGFS